MVFLDEGGSSDGDGTIVSYIWDFGDATGDSGDMVSHAYGASGVYTVVLTVTDDDGYTDTAEAAITVSAPSGPGIDYRYYDFFAVPYGEWWDMRTLWWFDRPIGAECFNADGIANGWCFTFDGSIPDVSSFPYTNWMVSPPSGNSEAYIVAPYRFSADIRQSTAYTIAKPVILPTCTELQALGLAVTCPTSPVGGEVELDVSMQYIPTARARELTARGCPHFLDANDGFISELRLRLTMDGTAASRLFGVADGSVWANGTLDTSFIKAGCG